MKRALATALCTLVLVACQDRGPNTPSNPLASISDGAHESGNPDFFFLPPMVPNPSSDPNFEAGAFNASLSPEVQICEGTGATGTECTGVEIVVFTMTTGLGSETVRVSALDEHYIVNFHTDNFALNPALTYRIRVLVGSTVLGHADVELGATRGELKNVNTNQFIPLLDGRTLPIKFRIENEALCDPPGSTCSSQTVDLGDDQADQITLATGDGIHIEPQANGQVHTITVQECADGEVDVDLPKFGRCLTITADPPIDEESDAPPLDPPAIIFTCNVDFEVRAAIAAGNLTVGQEPLVTMHRQHGETIQALPHARDFCPATIGSLPARGLKGLAQAGWNLVHRGLTAAFAPRPLYASLVMLDEGGGGESDFISDFQFALPAQMAPVAGTNGQTADVGTAVANPPAVWVTDRDGHPVAGATVRFAVTVGGGAIGAATALTGPTGLASALSWTLGPAAGANTVRASGRGIADPGDGGPFMPRVPSTESDVPVTVGTGEVFFNANAVVPSAVTPVSSSLMMVASSNANGTIVEHSDGESQTGTLNALSAEVSALAASGTSTVLTSGGATATWADAASGQVVFTAVGWEVQAAVENSHAHLTAGNDWTYTFVAGQSGTFTLQFNVTQDAGTTNSFGLNGFNFRWREGAGEPAFVGGTGLGTTGTFTRTVSAGTTYTVRVDNQANIFGPLGTRTAHMSGTFDWTIAAPIQ